MPYLVREITGDAPNYDVDVIITDHYRYQRGVHEGIEWRVGKKCDFDMGDYAEIIIPDDAQKIFKGYPADPVQITTYKSVRLPFVLNSGGDDIDFRYNIVCHKEGQEYEVNCKNCDNGKDKRPRIIVRNVIGLASLKVTQSKALVSMAVTETGGEEKQESLSAKSDGTLVWEVVDQDEGQVVSRVFGDGKATVLLDSGYYLVSLVRGNEVVLVEELRVSDGVAFVGQDASTQSADALGE